jgi:hypothetical protein
VGLITEKIYDIYHNSVNNCVWKVIDRRCMQQWLWIHFEV